MPTQAHDGHHDHEAPVSDVGITGRIYHFHSGQSESGSVPGTNGDDIYHIQITGRPVDQVHIYARGGHDTLHLDMSVPGASGNQHGHHIRLGSGDDVVHFANMHNMNGTVSGRFDDFNPDEDEIWIGDHKLDIYNPQALAGADAAVVLLRGQQYLDVRTSTGRLFYALEGPRNVNGSEEQHFVSGNEVIPRDLPRVDYVNAQNEPSTAVMEGLVRPNNLNGSGESEHLHGGERADLIDGSAGNDSLHGGANNDVLIGGRGLDDLFGDEGDDTLYGGLDADYLYGGGGNDLLVGGTENDRLNSGAGNDTLHGGMHNDWLHGGAGNDEIYGGHGNDTLIAGSGTDSLYGGDGNDLLTASGDGGFLSGGSGHDRYDISGKGYDAAAGEGSDTFTLASGATLRISDFNIETDKLDIGSHFIDEEDLLDFAFVTPNEEDPEVNDLLIELPEEGFIRLIGLGDHAAEPGKLVAGWGPEHLFDDDEDDGGAPPPDDDFPFPVRPPAEGPDEGDNVEDEGDEDDGGDGGFDIGGMLAMGLLAALIGLGGGGMMM